jgi:hypothetical protein
MFYRWTCLGCIKSPLTSVIPPEPVPVSVPTAPEPAAAVELTIEIPTEVGEGVTEETPQAPEAEKVEKSTDPNSIQYVGITVKPYLPPLPHSPKRLCETRLPSVPRFSIRQVTTAPADSADASRA